MIKNLLRNKIAVHCAFIFLFLILLVKKETVFAQNEKIVTGVVIQKGTNTALPDVSIMVKGSNKGVISDAEGHFKILASTNDVLVFSSSGYERQEISPKGESSISVVMAPAINNLSDVVVVGYTTEQRRDITGSVAVVSVKDLRSIPVGSAEQALQGQAAGVNVISTGLPGAPSNIYIRGITSFGNVDPLVLVDGVEANLNDISANDIESMQILKDAGSASIYGVRGSNGVIIVTTRKGKTGKPIVVYDGYYGVQLPKQGNVFNLLNSSDFARLSKVADPATTLFANGLPDYTYVGPGVVGIAQAGDPAVDPSNYVLSSTDPSSNYLIQEVNKQGTDWFHAVFKNAPITNQNVSVSGGTEKSKYLFSVGYFNQQGTLIDTYLKRYSARINTEFNLGNHVRVGENLYLFYKDNPTIFNQSEANPISYTYRMMPIIPIYDIKGNFGGTNDGPELGIAQNPVGMQARTINNRNNSWNAVGNAFIEVDFLRHFTARSSFGGSIENQYFYNFNFNQYNDRQSSTGANNFNENAAYNSGYIWTNTLVYNNTFGKNSVKILAGTEAIQNNGRSVGGSASNYFSTDYNYLFLSNGTTNITNYSTGYVNALYSVFGKLDYSFSDKYLFTATLRRDGSSVFGSSTRYGLFPSFTAGWRLSQEQFMKQIYFVNDLKIRGSYGILGSQNNVGPTNAYTLFTSGFATSYYAIAGNSNTVSQGFYQNQIGNPNTGWEQNKVLNIGIDASFFNNTVDLTVEYYQKSINGLLFPEPLPSTAGGANPPTVNVGDIRNTGGDLSIGYRGKVGQYFKFHVGVNLSTYNNKIVSIPDPGYFDAGGGRIGNSDMVRNQTGHPVSAFFGYKVIGLFQDDADVTKSPKQTDAAPGRFKYQDVNGDGVITPDDRTFFGNPNPDFTYGLNLSASFKNFDISAIFYGSKGNDVINYVRYWTDFFGSFIGGKSNDLLNAWTPGNITTKIPKVEIASSFSTSGAFNSFYLEDGSFLKMRSLQLGYTLSPQVLSKFRMNRFRVYVQGVNLFQITKYTGLDPEMTGSSSSFGIDYGNYPNNQKNYIIGISTSF